MAINLSIINFGQFARVSPIEITPAAPARQVSNVASDIAELSRARYELLRLRDALMEALDAAGVSRPSTTSTTTRIGSSGALVLDNSSRAAVLTSLEEINTIPTSYSPFGPAWAGGSTALATIGGIYDGSNGTGALTFQARSVGVRGEDLLRIRVRDPSNRILENVVIQPTDPLDTQYDIGNGLYFTLGSGSLTRNDEFTVDVFATTGSVVNVGNPFDGVRNANPNLDAGQSVTGGTLTINGVDIAVGADDSIDAVATAINQSGAGVTAVFDAATERLVLSQNTTGAEPTIDIQTDDSGFAAAAKLAGAVVVPGRDPDLSSPLDTVSQFQGVQSGTINVNGTAIDIDVTTDSLADVLARINGAQGDVTATYSEPPQKVSLEADRPIALDDGSTGFLAALNIASGSYSGARGNGLSSARATAITGTVRNVVNLLDGFLKDDGSSAAVGQIRTQLGALVSSFLTPESSNRADTFGFEYTAGSRRTRLDVQALTRNLQRRAADTLEFLAGNDSRFGLLTGAARNVDQAIAQLNNRLGLRGSTVDQFA